jgi:hypothetical protein
VHDVPGAQLDDEEGEEGTEEEVGQLQEVEGPDLPRVGAHESRPGLPGWARRPRAADVLLDRPRGRLAAPEQAETRAVPTQERLGLDDQECLAPGPDAACQQDEERAIGVRDARPFRGASERDQLLT